MALGSLLGSIGTGLIYTLEIDSNSAKWIGYQAIAEIGLGLILQIPVMVAQASVIPSDISSVSAIILFFQSIGGAIFISAAQAGFANKLLKELPIRAPTVNPGLVIATGATDLRKVFNAEELPGILSAFMEGLRVSYITSIACACATSFIAFAPRWENLKGKVKLEAGGT
jgi:hypothetical protein